MGLKGLKAILLDPFFQKRSGHLRQQVGEAEL